MRMSTSAIPDGWAWEGPDESVGIFGDLFVHDDCSVEFDHGTSYTSVATGVVGNDGMQTFTYTVLCLDCGGTVSFEIPEYVGRDEDVLMDEGDYLADVP